MFSEQIADGPQIVDVSTTDSMFRQYAKADDVRKVQELNLEVEKLDIKVGTLKVDLNSAGFGTIELDGKPVSGCYGLTLCCKVNEAPRVILEVYPISTGEK